MKLARILWREWQHYRSTHLLQILTLALGLVGFFTIEDWRSNFIATLRSQEKELLGADLALSARRPLGADELELARKQLGKSIAQETLVMDLYSMVLRPSTMDSRLVEVRFQDGNYPFYGSLNLVGGIPLKEFISGCAYASPELITLWGLQNDESLKVGEFQVKLCGTVEQDSTQGLRGISLAPRLYMSMNDLPSTKMLRQGTTGSFVQAYRLHLTERPTEEIQNELKAQYTDPAIKVRTPQDASEQLARGGKILGDYLHLASLVGFLLSLVGLLYLFRTYLLARRKDMAILRTLGYGQKNIWQILLGPLFANFFLAWGLAQLAVLVLRPVVANYVAKAWGFQLGEAHWEVVVALQGAALLVLAVLLVWPFLQEVVRRPAGLLLRDNDETSQNKRPWIIYCFALALLTLFAVWLSHSWRIGGLFMAALTGAFILLLAVMTPLFSIAGKWLLTQTRLERPWNLITGLSVRNLIRRRQVSYLIVIVLGLGTTLLSFIGHLENGLHHEFEVEGNQHPAFFLFDIQDEQLAELKDFTNKLGTPLTSLSPMVRAKLTHHNGQSFKQNTGEETAVFRTRESENESRFRTRVMNLSYAQSLNPSETLLEGVEFKDAKLPEGLVPISLEERFAKRLNIKLHDELSFDVLGVEVKGKVVNLRSVKWTSFQPNFFITMGPGVLEEAPKTWLATLPKYDPRIKAMIQNKLGQQFPNISMVDVQKLVEKLLQMFTQMKMVLQVMASFALAIGLLVLFAVAQDQVIRRQREFMLLKTLGLTPTQVLSQFLHEFLFIATLAPFLGALCGALLAQAIAHFIFQGQAPLSVGLVAILVLANFTISAMLVSVSAWRILRLKPAGLLQSI